MRFKIGGKWYDSDDQDLCVEFTEIELDQVKTMNPEVAPNRRFAVMEERGRTHEEIRAWIRECDK